MSPREALLKVSSAEFRDIAVSPCKVQTPGERFGDGAAKTMEARITTELHNMRNLNAGLPLSESEDETANAQAGRSAPRSARRKPPKLQNWRMNLTALSRVYNLYFAAYRNKIWVYCPVGPMARGLGQQPALIIDHSMSSVGSRIELRVPGWKRDEANHMIVGFLGDAEILLLCYENGDVTSYYTREIAAYITQHAQHTDPAPMPRPSPFFRANVGESAWGLAIHSKSRLIAVSSNKPEVTVFAFALTNAPAPGRFLAPPHSPAELAVLARKRNWRIVLPVKRTGHNIPNVDFVSCHLGYAQKISAVDVNGNIWILDIWRQETAPTLIVPQDNAWITEPHMSWAVVALPSSSFLDLGMKRNHHPRTYLSAEAAHARAIALGHGDIPLQHPFKNSRYWVDTSSAVTLVQELRSTAHDPLSDNRPGLSPLTGNDSPPIAAATLTASPSGDEEEPSGTGNGDDDNDDVMDDQDQPDTEEDESDGGEYDEGDVEEEVISWGEDDEDEGGINYTQIEWAPDVPITGLVPANVIYGGPEPPPEASLEDFLPAGLGQLLFQAPMLENKLPPDASEQEEKYNDGQAAPRMGMIYDPHRGMTYPEPADDNRWEEWLGRARENNTAAREQSQAEIAALGEHTSLFATDDSALRLLTTNRRFADIYCRGPADARPSHPGHARIRRVNMALHVPELNLVVAACQSGRVALVSLVRCPWALPTLCGDRGIRVDAVLPTPADDVRRRPRRRGPLFGVAVGPVPEVEDASLRLRGPSAPASFSCTYRLVLHFRDHSVYSYLVSRPSPDDLQVI